MGSDNRIAVVGYQKIDLLFLDKDEANDWPKALWGSGKILSLTH